MLRVAHIRGIIRNSYFYDWLIALSTVCMYPVFLTDSSFSGHLGCFYPLVIVNNAYMNIDVQICLGDLSVLLGIYPEWAGWIIWWFYF